MVESDATKQVGELLRSGKKQEARDLLTQILKDDIHNPRAWALLYHVARNEQEARLGLREVLRLRPDNEWAAEKLAKLEAVEQEQRQQKLITYVVQQLARGNGQGIVVNRLIRYKGLSDEAARALVNNVSKHEDIGFLRSRLKQLNWALGLIAVIVGTVVGAYVSFFWWRAYDHSRFWTCDQWDCFWLELVGEGPQISNPAFFILCGGSALGLTIGLVGAIALAKRMVRQRLKHPQSTPNAE
jgi:hypothetical protein